MSDLDYLKQRELLKKDQFNRDLICHICGHPISGYETAATVFDAKITDWYTKGILHVDINICEECFLKILENFKKEGV